MPTLYRKYRPQNFKEVVGQNHIKVTLSHEIESGKIAHAYIFCGPRAVGKTTLARVFSKAVNCVNRKENEHDPCNKCISCVDITAGRNLDILEIDAASHTGVDNVRDNIIATARVAPSSLKYKIFIIDEAHMLSVQAFNALLKVLEEPPANVLFILCTTEIHKVPSTIISRCQRFDFKRISVLDIVKKLKYIVHEEGIKIDDQILENVARYSEGHMRDAESLLGQVVSIGGKEITIEEADLVIPRSDLKQAIVLISLIRKKDTAAGISLINKLLDEGADLKRFTRDLIELLRKMLLIKINPTLSEKFGLELGPEVENSITEAVKELDLAQICSMIERFIKVSDELKGAFIVQLPLELAITELCLFSKSTNSYRESINQRLIEPGEEKIGRENAAKKVSLPVDGKINNISKEQIAEKWNEVLAKVKKYNHSLSFILRVCQPRDIAGNQLCLAFKYKFHRDRIGDHTVKGHIEQVLKDVYGQNLTVEAIVDESLDVENGKEDTNQANTNTIDNNPIKDNPGADKMMENLIKTFGGKVVK